MACSKYEKLLYLYRDGELVESERRKLHRHLDTCSNCRCLASDIISDLEKLGGLRVTLASGDQDHLLQETMNRVRTAVQPVAQDAGPARSKSPTGVQVAFALAIGVVLLVFVVQEIWVLNRLHALEQRTQGMPRETNVSDAVDFAGRVLAKNETLEKDYVVIDRLALEELLQSNRDLRITNRLLLETLHKTVPDLEKDFIDDGIDRSELELLLQNRNKIISALRKL